MNNSSLIYFDEFWKYVKQTGFNRKKADSIWKKKSEEMWINLIGIDLKKWNLRITRGMNRLKTVQIKR